MTGLPWRVAFALQAAGWTLRSDIILVRPDGHSYLFLLAKSPAYYYDADAIREPTVSLDSTHTSYRPNSARIATAGRKEYQNKHAMSARAYNPAGRNCRTVWPEDAYPERCILAGSREGDLVIDPWPGSDLVARAAQDLGRAWGLGFSLRTLPDDAVQACITSPPVATAAVVDVQAYVEALADVQRVLKPDGTLWLRLAEFTTS